MRWLSGDDRSGAGMNTEALKLVEQHYAEYGDAYARSFIASVPEPTTAVAVCAHCFRRSPPPALPALGCLKPLVIRIIERSNVRDASSIVHTRAPRPRPALSMSLSSMRSSKCSDARRRFLAR